MTNQTDLNGKVVLITGASSGIGKAAAEAFAAQGAKVALAARNAKALNELAAQLPGSLAVPTDMTNEASVARMVAQVKEHFGRIDILVNNAGRGMAATVQSASLQDYRDLFELNVVSVLHATQLVVPIMQAQGGGQIINISSGTTKMLIPGVGLYSSTKHALNNLSDIARLELAPLGVRVSTVYPGMTATNFGKNAVNSSPERAAGYSGGDSAEYVAGLIVEAAQTGQDDVYAEVVKGRLNPPSGKQA